MEKKKNNTPPEEDWSPRQPHTPADSPPHSPTEDKVRKSGPPAMCVALLCGGIFVLSLSLSLSFLICIHPLPLLPTHSSTPLTVATPQNSHPQLTIHPPPLHILHLSLPLPLPAPLLPHPPLPTLPLRPLPPKFLLPLMANHPHQRKDQGLGSKVTQNAPRLQKTYLDIRFVCN